VAKETIILLSRKQKGKREARTNDVRPLLRHVDEVAATSRRKLDGIHDTIRSNNIRTMAHTCPTRSAEIEDFLPRGDINIVQSAQHTSCQLRTEGVPHTVLGLDRNTILARGALDGDAFLAVDRLAGCNIFGDEELLFAFCDEDTRVSVGF